MPTIQIYLNDEIYAKYLKNKDTLNKQIQEFVKEEVKDEENNSN